MDVEWKKLVKQALRQGWRVGHGRKGAVKLFPPDPDKEMVVLHRTPSDHRAFRNSVARLRRQGLEWPPEGKGKR